MYMFYLVVGWIIVVGFGITLVITLLSLIGIIQVEEPYKKGLYRSLILEMVAAGFFIFYEGSPNLDKAKGYFLFNKGGDPDSLNLGRNFSFPKLPESAFEGVRRQVKLDSIILEIKTANGKTFLGYAPLSDVLSPEDALQLGLHYSEFENKKEKKRKGATTAIKYLRVALNSGLKDPNDREEAIKALYHLNEIFTESDFRFLIRMYEKHARGYIKYKELGDINFLAAENPESQPVDRLAFRTNALYNYLRYLAVQKSDNQEVDTFIKDSKKQVRKLVGDLKRDDHYVKTNYAKILDAVDKENTDLIEVHKDSIELAIK